MRNMKLTVLLALALGAAACNDVVSLAPLYDDATLTFEADLLGSWKVEEHETWTFKRAEGKMYRLTVAEIKRRGTEEQETRTEFEAALVRLSGRLFLDLMSDDSGATGAPAHVVARIEIENDVLHVGWLDSDWMKETLRKETWLTSHDAAHNKTVITAPTRDLQSFFRAHAWNDEAFLKGTGGPDDPNTFFPRIRE